MHIRGFIGGALYILVLTGFVATLAATAYTIRVYRSYNLGSKEAVMNRRETGLTLLDRHGRIFFTFDQSRFKRFVPLSDIPPHVQHAVIAAEDKSFYRHVGVSPTGILRAAYINLQRKDISFGGSTITQQLIKNAYFSPRKSFSRKLREAILAIKIERHFTKDDILEMYLNSAYFGENIFGIEAAAQTYFGKSAPDLSLSEAALLAGLLPEPANLSPLSGSTDLAYQRQSYVLGQMQKAGYISAPERLQAQLTPLTFNTNGDGRNAIAPHFAILVRDSIYRSFGKEQAIRAGLKVTTTLDLDWQQYAEQAVRSHVATLSNQRATNGAAVVIDPATGEILALVGSTGWHTDQFGKINMAAHPRQTGSAIKPIVYAAALQDRLITPISILRDTPRTFGRDYRPINYDRRFRGPVTVRYALGNSLNVPAVEVISRLGVERLAAMAQDFGLKNFADVGRADFSIALGSKETSLVDLTAAYTVFANNGLYHPPTIVRTITNKHYQPIPLTSPAAHPVVDPAVAYQITSILSDNDTRRPTFGNSLTLSFPVAVKTGTTQDFRDAWTVGYTPDLAVGVWIGNSNNDPMYKLAGALGAAPLWKDLISSFAQQTPANSFTPPTNIATATVCGKTEYFIPGTQPARSWCYRPRSSPTPDPDTPSAEEAQTAQQPDNPAPAPKPRLVNEAQAAIAP